MCGFSGIVSLRDEQVSPAVIRRMNDLVQHRGPDDEGFFFGRNFAFGHRRLSILDLSEAGHQPMSYLDRYTIIYNGEVYNYLELKAELLSNGYEFTSQTDTEVILAAYDQWGTDCVHRFNGMWAFAIYDKRKDIIFCSRDRFGIKPFYYTRLGGHFCFASEIKQFTIVDGWQVTMNDSRVLDFLKYAMFDHTEQTLYDGVFQLRSGHNLIYRLMDHRYTVQPWYDLADHVQPHHLSLKEAAASFKELLHDAIRLRLRSDVKVGSCLSGGLDSSSIVCIANLLLRKQEAQHNHETVSSCFDDKKYDEQEYIDKIVEQTKVVPHKIFPNSEELFSILDQIIWYQDEPFGSSSIFAQWNVFAEAKRHGLTVMLDGQGADELLAGYPRFYGAYFSYLTRRASYLQLLREIMAFQRLHRYSLGFIGREVAKKIMPRLYFPGTSGPMLRVFLKNFEGDNPYVPEAISSIRGMSIALLTRSNLPMLLHYEDRNSMAHSIESRVPFLDYRFVEFVLGLPEDFKIRQGITKWILRYALQDTLPAQIINRFDKMGFVTPEGDWLHKYKELFRSEFLAACQVLSRFINVKTAASFFDDQRARQLSMGSILWRVICAGRWARLIQS